MDHRVPFKGDPIIEPLGLKGAFKGSLVQLGLRVSG